MERPHLLSLATELLAEILRHVLVLEATESLIPKDPKPFLSVLGSCHKLREIGMDILLKENTYHLTASYPHYNLIEQTGGPIHLDRLATPSFNPRNVVRSIYLVIDKYGSKVDRAKVHDGTHCFRWLLPLKRLAWHGFWGTELVRMALWNDHDLQPIKTSDIEFLETVVEITSGGCGYGVEPDKSLRQSQLRTVARMAKDIWVRAKKLDIVEGIDEDFAEVIQDGVHLCMFNGPEDAEKRYTEDTEVISMD